MKNGRHWREMVNIYHNYKMHMCGGGRGWVYGCVFVCVLVGLFVFCFCFALFFQKSAVYFVIEHAQNMLF